MANAPQQPTLYTGWREPWAEINAALEPELRALGITHVGVRGDTMCFLTLPARCLIAFAELRELRERVARLEAERAA